MSKPFVKLKAFYSIVWKTIKFFEM